MKYLCFAEGRPLYINDDNSSQLLPQQPDNSAMCPAKSKCVICFMRYNLQLVFI